jgi:hypothetical protein
MSAPVTAHVHRTARIRLRLTRHQAHRCYQMLRSAGDVWAWLLDMNRRRVQQGNPPITNYQALCRELTKTNGFGELSTVGARSVLRRYADAWFQATRRRNQQRAGFPRRKRGLVPVRCYHGMFRIEDQRVRLPVQRGQPELWVRLARSLPYSPEQVRSVTLLADGGRLWLAVTAAVPVQKQDSPSGSPVSILASSILTRSPPRRPGSWCRDGRSAPRATSTSKTGRHARSTRLVIPRNLGSVGRGVGSAIASGSAGSKHAIVVASIKPNTRPQSRWSPSPSGSGSAPWRLAIFAGSPTGIWVGCRTFDCGIGAAPTCCKPSATRLSKPESAYGWWTSEAPLPPARPAGGASPNPRAASSLAHAARFRGTGT